MTSFVSDFYLTLTEIYLVLGISILIIFGVLVSMSSKIGYPLVSLNIGWVGLQIVLFSFFLVYFTPREDFFSWSYFLISDFFVIGTKLLLIIFFIAWFFTTFWYVRFEKVNSFEYWIFCLLSVLAMFFTVQAFDILSIYLCVEFQSLAFYILASFKRTSEFSTEAGLKYFILGAFSSALLLFGLSFMYNLTGLSGLGDFSKFFMFIEPKITLFHGVLVSLVFISMALFFKLTSAPFHMWSPDVYEGSPTSVTAFFSVFPKLVIIGLILRIFAIGFYNLFFIWKNIILISALSSIFVGSLGAFSQWRWKRFLAYSSINHVGFMLIGLSTGELEGIIGMFFYIIVYMVTTIAVFSFLLSFRIFEYPCHYQSRYIKDLGFLPETNPILALTLCLILFSMAGIPPLAGFFAKVFVLFSGLQNNAYGIILFSVGMSCISCFYYIRIVRNIYFSRHKTLIVTYPLDKENSLILAFSLFFIIFLFLDIGPISIFSMRMAIPF